MLLRLKLLGKGTDFDPYRVSLPTYSQIHGNISQGYAIVSVDPETLGLEPADYQDARTEETTEGTLILELPAAAIEKANTALDHRYAQKSGTFTVEHA